jgi:hypothetical protein
VVAICFVSRHSKVQQKCLDNEVQQLQAWVRPKRTKKEKELGSWRSDRKIPCAEESHFAEWWEVDHKR